MIEVLNRQRREQLDPEHYRRFTARALKAARRGRTGVTVVFVSDRLMRSLNQRWRGKSLTTDVLSFPAAQSNFEQQAERTMGDIVISVERAKAQAKLHRLSLDREISQLILHGVLHLCGYDHETDSGEMNRLELRLRERLGI